VLTEIWVLACGKLLYEHLNNRGPTLQQIINHDAPILFHLKYVGLKEGMKLVYTLLGSTAVINSPDQNLQEQ